MRPYYDYGQNTGYSQTSSAQFGIGSRMTPAVRVIIFACIIVFIAQLMLGRGPVNERLITLFAFTPALAFRSLYLWQFVTYMFLHDGFWHIALNLISLWMIGGLVEERLGTRSFLWLYFLSGIGGALVQGVFFPSSTTVGASAGIMGVAAAVAMLNPDLVILVMFILPMKMKHFVWLLVGLQVLGAMSASQGGGGGVAYLAHLAGLAVGYLFVKYHLVAGSRLNNLYYRIRGRFRGFTGAPKVTHIDNDDKYREEVDRLLDKIFKEGTQSLTREESDFLKRQSEKYKREV